jgi:cytochrome c
MKKVAFLVALGLILATVSVWAGQGEEIFKAQRCDSCHKPGTGKANPSLKEIAQAYHGKEDQLINYLKGGGESIIKPEKAGMMKRYIEKTKALSNEDRKALADFLLSHRD